MIDLLQMLQDPYGYEVAWDYCLENGLAIPTHNIFTESAGRSFSHWMYGYSTSGHTQYGFRNSSGSGKRSLRDSRFVADDFKYWRSCSGHAIMWWAKSGIW